VLGTRAIKTRDLSAQLKSIYTDKRGLYLVSKYGGIVLSIATLLLYNRYITDVLTSLKTFDAHLLRSLRLKSDGRDLDTEILAKLGSLHEYILEVPVDYSPRTRAEGKKIRLVDGLGALAALFRYRRFRDTLAAEDLALQSTPPSPASPPAKAAAQAAGDRVRPAAGR
jgi:hypothetical protein